MLMQFDSDFLRALLYTLIFHSENLSWVRAHKMAELFESLLEDCDASGSVGFSLDRALFKDKANQDSGPESNDGGEDDVMEGLTAEAYESIAELLRHHDAHEARLRRALVGGEEVSVQRAQELIEAALKKADEMKMLGEAAQELVARIEAAASPSTLADLETSDAVARARSTLETWRTTLKASAMESDASSIFTLRAAFLEARPGSASREWIAEEVRARTPRERARLARILDATMKPCHWPRLNANQPILSASAQTAETEAKTAFADLVIVQLIDEEMRESGEERGRDRDVWAVEALVRPLAKRFHFHFSTPGKATNRIDRPEWFIAFVLQSIRDNAAFLRDVLRPHLLATAAAPDRGFPDRAMAELDLQSHFTRALVKLVHGRVKVLAREYEAEDGLVAHLVDELLAGDRVLTGELAYPASWPTLSDVLWQSSAQNEDDGDAAAAETMSSLLKSWIRADLTFVRQRLRADILASPQRWYLLREFLGATDPRAGPAGRLQPTESSDRLMAVAQGLGTRYDLISTEPDAGVIRVVLHESVVRPLLEEYAHAVFASEHAQSARAQAYEENDGASEKDDSSRDADSSLNSSKRKEEEEVANLFVSETWWRGVARRASSLQHVLDTLREWSLTDRYLIPLGAQHKARKWLPPSFMSSPAREFEQYRKGSATLRNVTKATSKVLKGLISRVSKDGGLHSRGSAGFRGAEEEEEDGEEHALSLWDTSIRVYRVALDFYMKHKVEEVLESGLRRETIDLATAESDEEFRVASDRALAVVKQALRLIASSLFSAAHKKRLTRFVAAKIVALWRERVLDAWENRDLPRSATLSLGALRGLLRRAHVESTMKSLLDVAMRRGWDLGDEDAGEQRAPAAADELEDLR